MMREMKDHELELVTGGRDGLSGGDDVEAVVPVMPGASKLKTEKYLNGVAKAAPFLLVNQNYCLFPGLAQGTAPKTLSPSHHETCRAHQRGKPAKAAPSLSSPPI